MISPHLPHKISQAAQREKEASAAAEEMRPPQPATIVVYIYSNSDPEYERNLQFFVEHGVRGGTDCHYVIVVQQVRLRHSPGTAPGCYVEIFLARAQAMVYDRSRV